MRTLLLLVRKDFQQLLRNKAALSLSFVVPFAMIWLFGTIFGVNRKNPGPTDIPLAVVNASTDPAAAKLVAALRSEKSFQIIESTPVEDGPVRPLTEDDVKAMMEKSGATLRFALVLPADLIRPGSFGLRLRILSNPRNEIETQMVNGLLQKTIFTNVPELLGQMLQAQTQSTLGADRAGRFNQAMASAVGEAYGLDPTEVQRKIEAGDLGIGTLTGATGGAGGAGGGDLLASLVQIETVQIVGAQVKSPQATGIVGGWAIQFLLFAVSASAASLFRERDAGLFQRLLAAPVTRAHVLWSKFIYGVILGLLQLLVLFTAGSALFGIDVGQHLFALIVVSVFAAATCTSFGMLIAAFSPNAEAASGLATFCIMLMSALGGAWFPISIMPAVIQQFSKLTLVYWSMEGFSAVLWAGRGVLEILPILGILGGIVAVVMSIAVWRFNRSNLFG